MQAMVKVAPAVAAGCTAVLKPSELASLSCLRLGELLAEAGAPPGALNVISGAGAGGAGQGQSAPALFLAVVPPATFCLPFGGHLLSAFWPWYHRPPFVCLWAVVPPATFCLPLAHEKAVAIAALAECSGLAKLSFTGSGPTGIAHSPLTPSPLLGCASAD